MVNKRRIIEDEKERTPSNKSGTNVEREQIRIAMSGGLELVRTEGSNKLGFNGVPSDGTDNVFGSCAVKAGQEQISTLPAPRIQRQIATRSATGRLVKRAKKEFSPPSSPPRKQVKVTNSTTSNNGSTPEQTKTRRHWELWSTNDTNVFFEALAEHGRDFDAIQAAISSKHKKKGPIEAISKSKEQIRHFYYRTWHKIAKYIEKTEGVSKHAVELYGLINYGELRKKIGSKMDDKYGIELNKLIHHGTTVVKHRGKKLRVKTPICRALKKLNHCEEVQRDENGGRRVPDQITIELSPKTNAAWTHVQMMSQNPRLRLTLKSNRTLASVIDFLHAKWKPDRVRMKEKIGGEEDRRQQLKIHLPSESIVTPFSIQPTASTGEKLDFTHYLQHIKSYASNSSPVNKKSKPSREEESQLPDNESVDCETCISSPGAGEKSSCNSVSATSVVKADQSDNGENMTKVVTSDIDLNSMDASQVPQPSVETAAIPTGANDDSRKMATMQEGVTRSSANELKVAEVYLMLGSPCKVHLEYEWVDCRPVRNILDLKQNLTNMLQRLVHLATTEFTDFRQMRSPPAPRSESKVPCLCGGSGQGDNKNKTPPNNRSGSRTGGRGTCSPAALLPKPPRNSPSTPRGNHQPDKPSTPRTPGGGPATPKSRNDAANCDESPTSTRSPLASSLPESEVSKPEVVFRVPMSVAPRIMPRPMSQSANVVDRNSLMANHPELFMPKRLHRIRRNFRKPIVVQRTLLPKTEEPTRQIMTLTMLSDSRSSQSASFMPVVASPAYTIQASNEKAESSGQVANQEAVVQADTPQDTSDPSNTVVVEPKASQMAKGKRRIVPTPLPITCEPGTFPPASVIRNSSNLLRKAAACADIIAITTCVTMGTTASSVTVNSEGAQTSTATTDTRTSNHMPQAITGLDAFLPGGGASIETPTPRSSSPISSILDISLPEPVDAGVSTDKLIDLALANSSGSFSGLLEGAADSSDKSGDPLTIKMYSSTTTSGSTSLCAEEQWLNGEDFNLSTFLDSPLKRTTALTTISSTPSVLHNLTPAFNEASRDSIILGKLDVDSTLQCMMNENSLDYVAKFADLAAQIAAQGDSQTSATPTSLK